MSAITIQPRKVVFDVTNVPRHWNGGDPVLTRFFDALSVHFPEGERFFIESVRHFQDQAGSERLREDIRHFIRQEGQHGIVHDRFNQVMAGQGVDVQEVTVNLRRFIKVTQKYLPKKYQLAMTAAFEHFTATLGEAMLKEETDMFREADPVMRALFLWHGVEEVGGRDPDGSSCGGSSILEYAQAGWCNPSAYGDFAWTESPVRSPRYSYPHVAGVYGLVPTRFSSLGLRYARESCCLAGGVCSSW